MNKHCVLICGPTVATDNKLVVELQKSTIVLKNKNSSRIESTIKNKAVSLIILEITKKGSLTEVELIKNIKDLYPNIEIILINGHGDRDITATAFANGARDAFRMPYKISLIVERVNAILDQQ